MMLVSMLQIFSWLPYQFTFILFFYHVTLFKRLCPRFFVSLLKTITPDTCCYSDRKRQSAPLVMAVIRAARMPSSVTTRWNAALH